MSTTTNKASLTRALAAAEQKLADDKAELARNAAQEKKVDRQIDVMEKLEPKEKHYFEGIKRIGNTDFARIDKPIEQDAARQKELIASIEKQLRATPRR